MGIFISSSLGVSMVLGGNVCLEKKIELIDLTENKKNRRDIFKNEKIRFHFEDFEDNADFENYIWETKEYVSYFDRIEEEVKQIEHIPDHIKDILKNLQDGDGLQIFIIGEHHDWRSNKHSLIELAKEKKINLFLESNYRSFEISKTMNFHYSSHDAVKLTQQREKNLIENEQAFLLEEMHFSFFCLLDNERSVLKTLVLFNEVPRFREILKEECPQMYFDEESFNSCPMLRAILANRRYELKTFLLYYENPSILKECPNLETSSNKDILEACPEIKDITRKLIMENEILNKIMHHVYPDFSSVDFNGWSHKKLQEYFRDKSRDYVFIVRFMHIFNVNFNEMESHLPVFLVMGNNHVCRIQNEVDKLFEQKIANENIHIFKLAQYCMEFNEDVIDQQYLDLILHTIRVDEKFEQKYEGVEQWKLPKGSDVIFFNFNPNDCPENICDKNDEASEI